MESDFIKNIDFYEKYMYISDDELYNFIHTHNEPNSEMIDFVQSLECDNQYNKFCINVIENYLSLIRDTSNLNCLYSIFHDFYDFLIFFGKLFLNRVKNEQFYESIITLKPLQRLKFDYNFYFLELQNLNNSKIKSVKELLDNFVKPCRI